MNKQKGFTLVEGLLIVLILSVIGFAGYTVWNNQQDDKTVQTETPKQNEAKEQSKNEAVEPIAKESEIPVGWKTISENGLTVSYPASWDDIEEESQKLSVIGAIDGDIAYVGFGAPIGYKHLDADNWQRVDGYGSPAEGNGPTLAEVNVEGALSTIITSSGDGGCRGSKIVFATNIKLYAVALPEQCEEGAHGAAGIDSELVAQDLNKIIKLISIDQ